jgi:hypothetical protein
MANKIQVEQIEGIEIANPVYDVVFKHLMENTRVASYFIEALTEEKVEDLTMRSHNFTVFKWSSKFEKFNLTPEDIERLKKLTVLCLDFVATIKTEGEYKKVLIEIQKARNTSDVWRFRDYLAANYKRREVIKERGRKKNDPIPIITIYLLGFNLQETDEEVIISKRNLLSGRTKKALNVTVPFMEYLTHDCYLVQLGRITGKTQTRLDRVLSVFEQRYFIDDKTRISKKYPYKADDEILNLMVEILEHVNADPEQRAEIELEWMSHEVLNSMVLDKEKMIKDLRKQNLANKKAIAANKKAIIALQQKNAAKDQTIAEKDETIAAKDEAIVDLQQQNEKLLRELDELKKRP